MEWIDVNERLPTEVGWYDVKTKIGEVRVPLARTFGGGMIWVYPTPTSITHWKENEEMKQAGKYNKLHSKSDEKTD